MDDTGDVTDEAMMEAVEDCWIDDTEDVADEAMVEAVLLDEKAPYPHVPLVLSRFRL